MDKKKRKVKKRIKGMVGKDPHKYKMNGKRESREW